MSTKLGVTAALLMASAGFAQAASDDKASTTVRRSDDGVEVVAPTTRVETDRKDGRRVKVEAPYSDVRVDKDRVRVKAPFVDIDIPRR